MRRSIKILLATCLAGTALLPGTADGYYGNGAQIVSAEFNRRVQADDTTFQVAAADGGRYVVFETIARNLFPDGDADPPGQYRQGGIFRFDLETRRLALVADGDLREESTDDPVNRGARNPSISADGRFVAFSTGQRLVPQDVNGNVDVYVRDLSIAKEQAGAYDLVSARTGGDTAATYTPSSFPSPGFDPGSEVSPSAAMSADGSRVVFRSTERSDLPLRGTADTPADQILVRDRDANTTTLVTRRSADGEPAAGALNAGGISADGSTVTWTGENAPSQSRFQPGESTEPTLDYYLWRRVADGPTAPTRRITGLADPDDPACPPEQPIVPDISSSGPCYGPLAQQEGVPANIGRQVPALSGDGRRVAFLTGSGTRGSTSSAPGLDLYATDMSPGVSRKAGTTELTRDLPSREPETSSPIGSVAMSSDGSTLAITTARIRFVLPALRFVGSPRTVGGPAELYVVDLPSRTVERATRGADGSDIDSDVLDGTSLSSDGSRVAFTSFAGDLFFGDSGSKADAFVITRQPEPGESPPPPPDTGTGVESAEDIGGSNGPFLGARARTLRNGNVALTVRVPGAGGLKAEAKSAVGRPRRRRSLAVKTTRARRPGQVRIVLSPVRRYRREVRRRKRVLARVTVGFVASRGGRRLRTSVRATFKRPTPARTKKRPRRSPKR